MEWMASLRIGFTSWRIVPLSSPRVLHASVLWIGMHSNLFVTLPSTTGPCLMERGGRLKPPEAERTGRSAAAEGTPAARAAPLRTRGRTPRVAAQARRPFPRSHTGAVEAATACVASVWTGSVVQYVRGYERRRREHAGQQETAVCAS